MGSGGAVAPYNFFALNSLQSISSLYGTHPWHWYLTEANPVLLSFSLPLFLHSLYRHATHPLTRSVLPVMAVTLLAYSSNPHKEYRFILPLLPLAILHCGLSLSSQPPTWIRRKAYAVVLIAGNAALFPLLRPRPPVRAHLRSGVPRSSHPRSVDGRWRRCGVGALLDAVSFYPPVLVPAPGAEAGAALFRLRTDAAAFAGICYGPRRGLLHALHVVSPVHPAPLLPLSLTCTTLH